MKPLDWTLLSLQIAAMLATALVLGQLARKLKMPALVGEIAGGLLLGPTILGRISPQTFNALFPMAGPLFDIRNGMFRIGMIFFIVTIGLEISLSEFRKVSRKALLVGVVGTFVPLFLGFLMCYTFPSVIGVLPKDQFSTALFMGSVLSLSANPVIARLLMDMGLFKSEIGRIIMSATLVDDLVGWGLFAVILAEFGPNSTGQGQGVQIFTIVFLYVVLILLAGKYVFPKLLQYVHDKMPRPSAFIATVLMLALLGAAGSEYLGLHSFLGAFVIGIALAEVYRHHPGPFDIIGQFSYSVFTPVFFVSMAIGADFIKGFDLALVALITGVAFLGKVAGVFLGGKMAGMDNRQALAVGAGLNARGILGIVMSAAAYEAQLIELRLFVACVLMCVFTTMAAGPALNLILGRRGDEAVAQ